MDAVNKILIWICVYSYYYYCYWKEKLFPHRSLPREQENRHILLLSTGVLGDSLLFLDALRELERMYPASEGYRIDMVCGRTAARIFREYGGCGQISYICYDGDRYRLGISEFMRIAVLLEKRRYLFMYDSDGGDAGVRWLPFVRAERKYVLERESFSRRKPYVRFLIQKCYTCQIPTEQRWYGRRHGDFLRFLGNRDYRAGIARIRAAEEKRAALSAGEEAYAVVAPEGRSACQSMTLAQTCAAAEHIYRRYGCKIVFCAAAGSIRAQEAAGRMKGEGAVNLSGKTAEDEFIALVAGAKLLVGCDSGHIHLAASLGVQSVCLLGQSGDGLFLPYDPERRRRGDRTPVCVRARREFACRGCAERRGAAGRGNEDCMRSLRKGRPALCVQKIGEKDLCAAIDRVFRELE